MFKLTGERKYADRRDYLTAKTGRGKDFALAKLANGHEAFVWSTFCREFAVEDLRRKNFEITDYDNAHMSYYALYVAGLVYDMTQEGIGAFKEGDLKYFANALESGLMAGGPFRVTDRNGKVMTFDIYKDIGGSVHRRTDERIAPKRYTVDGLNFGDVGFEAGQFFMQAGWLMFYPGALLLPYSTEGSVELLKGWYGTPDAPKFSSPSMAQVPTGMFLRALGT